MPDNPIFIGLDLSYTSTGVSTLDGGTLTIKTKPQKGRRGDDIWRCREIACVIRGIINQRGVTCAVIEGGVNHSNAAFGSGKLHGIIGLMLGEKGIPWVEVAPNSLKKFAAGTGVAEKSQMIAHARERFGYDGFQNDEADAYLLRMMGEAAVGRFYAKVLTKPRIEAVLKQDWPFDVVLMP